MSDRSAPIITEPNALGPKAALQRIDAALARIEAALPKVTRLASKGADTQSEAALAELRQRHGALRIATAGALAQMDALLCALDTPALDSASKDRVGQS